MDECTADYCLQMEKKRSSIQVYHKYILNSLRVSVNIIIADIPRYTCNCRKYYFKFTHLFLLI